MPQIKRELHSTVHCWRVTLPSTTLHYTHTHGHPHTRESKPFLSCVQIYTIWNYRREALEPIFAAGGEAAQAASAAELALTQACLQVILLEATSKEK
jgi:hypothetical protein